jgi:acetoin utilization deacetylase AcuC-like enzyme
LDKLESSGLSAAEQRRLGLPWSAELWQRSLLACGGTLWAARTARDSGLAANLAGGTHHAFADHAEGFCVLNDVAVAINKLRKEARIARALIVDLDVHQGNGTAAIFEGVEDVFTFSMHGERNYPTEKMHSNVDVGLKDGVEDAEYLGLLREQLPAVLDAARPDMTFYLAGVDVAAGDRYGKLEVERGGHSPARSLRHRLGAQSRHSAGHRVGRRLCSDAGANGGTTRPCVSRSGGLRTKRAHRLMRP